MLIIMIPVPLVFTRFVRKTKCTDNYLEAKLSSYPLLYVTWEPWRKSSSDHPVSQQIKHLWAVKTKILKRMLRHFSKPFFYLVYKFIEVYKEWITDKLVCSSGHAGSYRLQYSDVKRKNQKAVKGRHNWKRTTIWDLLACRFELLPFVSLYYNEVQWWNVQHCWDYLQYAIFENGENYML